MHNYSVDKEPDYLQMNVFSRTSKGNIIYTRQNKNLLFMVTFGAYSILSLFLDIKVNFLDFLKDSCFTFFIQKVYKKRVCQPIDLLTYWRYWRGNDENNIDFFLIFGLTSKIINTGTCFALLLKMCVD